MKDAKNQALVSCAVAYLALYTTSSQAHLCAHKLELQTFTITSV